MYAPCIIKEINIYVITFASEHEHGKVDSVMVKQQVSPGETWCLIISLVSFWSSPLCDMYVCLLLILATVVIRILY